MRGNEAPEDMLKNNYEVEVLVNGKPLKEYASHGKIYVEGRENTVFSLRLRNNSGSRKLFIPSIDGLSVMNGEECSFDSSGYIVRPYSAVTVDGWRISDHEVAQFYFSAPNDSYRKRMDRGNNLGVIGVAIFEEKERQIYGYRTCNCGQHFCSQCHPQFSTSTLKCRGMDSVNLFSVNNASVDMNLKADATVTSANVLQSVSQDLGTGWGSQKNSEVVSVAFERGDMAEKFEIYYNTRDQLEKIGVDFRKEPLYVSPQSFPGQYCKPPRHCSCDGVNTGCNKPGCISQ